MKDWGIPNIEEISVPSGLCLGECCEPVTYVRFRNGEPVIYKRHIGPRCVGALTRIDEREWRRGRVKPV